MTADPWGGVRRGDRFYNTELSRAFGTGVWEEVTDLWFDPVRGQCNARFGYVVAVRLFGYGDKRTLCAATLATKRYVRVTEAKARAETDAKSWDGEVVSF